MSAGDPPLDQVITHILEAGVRGVVAESFTWNAGIFRAGTRRAYWVGVRYSLVTK